MRPAFPSPSQRRALALLASTLLLVACPGPPPEEGEERTAVCGDGVVGAGEACDDGNTLTESACTYGQTSCTRCDAACATVLQLAGPRCGDGRRDASEACDDGNTLTETACPYGTQTCQACTGTCAQVTTLVGASCGDGVRNGPEACDDGNTSDGDTCTTLCTAGPAQAAACGNGVLEAGEACDDGNTAGGDGCPAACGLATSASDCVASTDTRLACPVTLQTLKASVTGSPVSSPFHGKKVSVRDARVVGRDVSGTGYWLYQAPAAGAPEGHSGIYVSGAAGARALGEHVDVREAHVELRFGQLQLGSVAGGTQLSVESRSVVSALPAPVRVTAAQVRTGGPRAAELNGMRVELTDVVVTSANPDAPGNFQEFVVDATVTDPAVAGVRVDDQGYDYANPAAGDRYALVRGVLAYTFSNAKVLPQQAEDLQRLTAGVPARGQAATLDVGSWNIEWFGDTTNGPSNEAQQAENVRAVLAGTALDLWGVAEIVDTAALHRTVAEVPGYASLMASDVAVTGGSTHYSASEQKVGIVYRTAEVQVVSAAIILAANTSDFAGRPPLEVKLRVAPGGAPAQDLVLVVLHMKAFADSTSWARRDAASKALKSYLDTTYPTQKVLVVGDFNDDVDTSITSGQPSPYANFVQDSADYTFVTGTLSASGQATTTGYPDAIDHHLATNDVAATLVPGSVEVLRLDAVIPSYASTTSDHYPVLSRYAP